MNSRAQKKYRRCLGCGDFFLSHSAGNRFCPRCKKNQSRHAYYQEPITDIDLIDTADKILKNYN